MDHLRPIQRADLLKALGLPSKIPAAYRMEPAMVRIVAYDGSVVWETVQVLPTVAKGLRLHRVAVMCKTCHKWIPAGRIRQHSGPGHACTVPA